MKRSVKLLMLLATLVASPVADAGDTTATAVLFGAWQRGDGVARVKVAACGGAICMTNTWIKSGSDEKVGEYLTLDLKPSASGQFSGTGYDPQRKARFAFDVTLAGDRMTTRGCLLGGLVCRTTDWSRLH
jgi:uncharacterized protein (DUF2147 family)